MKIPRFGDTAFFSWTKVFFVRENRGVKEFLRKKKQVKMIVIDPSYFQIIFVPLLKYQALFNAKLPHCSNVLVLFLEAGFYAPFSSKIYFFYVFDSILCFPLHKNLAKYAILKFYCIFTSQFWAKECNFIWKKIYFLR